MIKSIIMKNCASFKGTPAIIDNCGLVNFIYGANGSGKSTISNFLLGISSDFYKDSKIEWDNENVSELVVYNRTFRDNNFGKDAIDGIFTLGEQNIETLRKIDNLKIDLNNCISNKQNLKNQLEQSNKDLFTKDNEIKEWLWELLYKKYEKTFLEAFKGFRNNKEKFKTKIMEIIQYVKGSDHAGNLTIDELQKRSEILFQKQLEKYLQINIIQFEQICNTLISIEKNEIWHDRIIGNNDIPLAELIISLGNSEWVSKGRNYILDNNICPFCQKSTIDDIFRKQLSDFFDNNYSMKIDIIKNVLSSYQQTVDKLLTELKIIINNDIYKKIGNLDIETINKNIYNILQIFQENIKSINNKIEDPAIRIKLLPISLYLREIIFKLNSSNKLIEEYNITIDDQNTQRKILIDDIWKFIANEHIEKIEQEIKERQKIVKRINGLKKGISHFEEKIHNKNLILSNLNKQITSIIPSINEINRLLGAYGFNNFKIVPSKENNKYQIMRDDGQLANHTLSEGEETFITFLYFIQLIKGTKNPSSSSFKKILIIDDPISSLDSTVLYVVSAIIKDLINNVEKNSLNIEQIFILTHNVYFHKEISFIHGKSNQRINRKFWIITKNNGISQINSYDTKNPINSSYELLWNEIKNDSTSSIVTIQNTMRRIIENYFRIMGTSNIPYEFIVSKFNTLEEKIICRALLSWINDGSHIIPDDLHIDSYSDTIDRYKQVFHKIFINTGHEAHYNMMMGLEI